MSLRETLKRIQFQGAMHTDADKTAQVLFTAEYELYDPSRLDMQLAFLGDTTQQGCAESQLSNLKYDHLIVKPSDEFFLPAEAFGLKELSWSRDRAAAVLEQLQYGIVDTKAKDSRTYYVTIELQPSGILSSDGIIEMSYKGSIKVEHSIAGAVNINGPLGNLTVEEIYGFYDSEEFGNEMKHRIRRAAISGTINLAAGDSLKTLHEELVAVVADICKMLSLCYRQPVDWYYMTYMPMEERSEGFAPPEPFVRRRLPSNQGKTRHDEFINFRNLVNGGLDALVAAYRTSPQKDLVRRSLVFLAASHRETTLEFSFFLAYSSLEAVVQAALPEDKKSFGSSQWKRLERKLASCVTDFVEAEQVDIDPAMVIEKLPELRRATGITRIQAACEAYSVKVDDVWTKKGFYEGLKGASRIRNELFHAARLRDADAASKDVIRLQSLTERLLLALLKWPSSEIWLLADRHLSLVNRGDG